MTEKFIKTKPSLMEAGLRAYRRMAARLDYLIGNKPILLPMDWTYRHTPEIRQNKPEKFKSESEDEEAREAIDRVRRSIRA